LIASLFHLSHLFSYFEAEVMNGRQAYLYNLKNRTSQVVGFTDIPRLKTERIVISSKALVWKSFADLGFLLDLSPPSAETSASDWLLLYCVRLDGKLHDMSREQTQTLP
jgi:hypothetical protein